MTLDFGDDKWDVKLSCLTARQTCLSACDQNLKMSLLYRSNKLSNDENASDVHTVYTYKHVTRVRQQNYTRQF